MAKHLLISVVGLLLCGVPLRAQGADTSLAGPSFGWWLSGGVGSNRFGPGMGLSASGAWQENVLSLRYQKATEFAFGPGEVYDRPSIWFQQVSLLYGREYRERRLVWSLLAGLAYTRGVDRGGQRSYHTYEVRNLSGISFPLEMRLRAEFSRYVGLGLTGLGSFSAGEPVFGWMLEICVGRF